MCKIFQGFECIFKLLLTSHPSANYMFIMAMLMSGHRIKEINLST